jgi:O-antigen/teichoic acid export membrane protein
MNSLRKIVSNTVISLLGQLITWTSTLVLTIAYGRFLGDARFGDLYFAITFVALIGFPIEFGFNQQLTRDVAQELSKARRYLSNAILLKALLWLVLYGCILLLCWLLKYSVQERILVAICGITLLCTSITNTFSSLHYAYQHVRYPVIGTILEKGLGALIGFLALRQGANVQTMAFILLFAAFVNTLCVGFAFHRLIGVSVALDVKLLRDLVRTGIPFLIYGVLGVIYYRIDTVLLSQMTSDRVVGWYGAGYRLFDTLIFLPSLVISAIMYPVFARLTVSVEAEDELETSIEKTTNFLLFCGIPIAVALIATAPAVIAYLYHNPDFSHSVPVLQALAPGLVFLYINSVFSAVLMSTKREKKMTQMAAIALIFNLGLNLLLIPHFQQIAAAAVTSLTELLLLILSIVFIPKYLLPRKSLLVAGKALGASLVMAAVAWLLRPLPILLVVAAMLPTYLIVAFLIGTIPREDLYMLYLAVRNKTRKTVTKTTIPVLPRVTIETVAVHPIPVDVDMDNDETIPRMRATKLPAEPVDDEDTVHRAKRSSQALQRP